MVLMWVFVHETFAVLLQLSLVQDTDFSLTTSSQDQTMHMWKHLCNNFMLLKCVKLYISMCVLSCAIETMCVAGVRDDVSAVSGQILA